MIRHIKKPAKAADVRQTEDRGTEQTVRGILGEVRARGDEALREYSEKFDRWTPPSFRLDDAAIQRCLDETPARVRDDIIFAQTQIRRFAEHQRAALKDVEVETIPGVILGHKNVPVGNVGCYVPGGKYPLVASAHMGIVTAKAAADVPWAPPCATAGRRWPASAP